MLDNLRIFIAAVEQGSLSGAAAALDMTIATVSRRVSELEKSLGSELLHRSNRGLSLTPAGQRYYDECAAYIREVETRLADIDASLNELAGNLRICAPRNIGSGPLDLFWQQFVARYPQIALSLNLVDPSDDMTDARADLNICSGEQKNSALIQKHLGSITPVLVTSPQGPKPETLDALAETPTIAADIFSDWTLHSGEQTQSIKKQHQHLSNDMSVTLNLAKAGAGVALLPLSLVHEALADGSLVRVLPEWSGADRPIYLIWPYQRALSIRARVFRDALIDFLREQHWFNNAPGL